MAKKLILLLLLIPIIVMICLFAATKTLSNLVDVPVSGIEIIDTNSHVYLDLDKAETYTLEYAVYPTSAKNKSVTPSTEKVEGKNLASLEFVPEGDNAFKIIPKSAGSAKVYLTTVNGGFKDSIIVHVESTALTEIDCSVPKSVLAVGESTVIHTEFVPSAPSDSVCSYESSNPSVATVNVNGVIKAVGKGTATITITSNYNPEITDVLTIEVYNQNAMDLGASEIISSTTSGKIPISIDNTEDFKLSYLSYKIFDDDGNEVSASLITAGFAESNGSYSLNYSFNEEGFVGNVTIQITYNDGIEIITKDCKIERIENISIKFVSETALGYYTGQNVHISYELTPEDAEVTYSVSVSNDNIKAILSGSRLIVTTFKAGVTKLTLKATSVNSPNQTAEASIDIVVKPKGLSVEESANTYGIENLLTIGNFEYNASGSLVNTSNTAHKFSLGYVINGGDEAIGAGFTENLTWVSDTPDVYIDKNGTISFANDTYEGIVGFTAMLSYGGIEECSEKFSIRCVADGVNVYSYSDLYNATSAGKKVILHNNIKEDFGYINGEAKYTEIHTTYDDTYYKNTNSLDAAKVKILIEFKNDVYGNGYEINAHNLAYGLDDADVLKSDALFKGPLNFVALLEGDNSISVKGQDNICFAIYENVSVSNISLKGCDLTPDSDNNVDLVDLTYTGTTVEILGDNTSISYSRLTNGRTVLRAFGDINDDAKVINININNSVLSGAREFIMRIGSNCFVDGTLDNYSPKLEGDSGSDHNAKETYNRMTDEEKAAYDAKFIKTFVNVKNSVFKDAGLFAIGIDSHFSGPALADGKQIVTNYGWQDKFGNLIDNWVNLAKTSYGAKLTFEGEVELFCWKDLKDVDSSTLMNIPTGSVGGLVGSIVKQGIDFDVQEMISELSKQDGYSEITYKSGGTTYVHAGIAFFGGGKNYGVFDSKVSSGYTLSRFKVSLMDLGKEYFRFAAGDESFYFFMYNADSAKSGFSYADQEAALGEGGNGYDCIYK